MLCIQIIVNFLKRAVPSDKVGYNQKIMSYNFDPWCWQEKSFERVTLRQNLWETFRNFLLLQFLLGLPSIIQTKECFKCLKMTQLSIWEFKDPKHSILEWFYMHNVSSMWNSNKIQNPEVKYLKHPLMTFLNIPVNF